MLYDVFIFVLTAVGAAGAVVFSFKIANSSVRRVGIVRDLSRPPHKAEKEVLATINLREKPARFNAEAWSSYLKTRLGTDRAAEAGWLSIETPFFRDQNAFAVEERDRYLQVMKFRVWGDPTSVAQSSKALELQHKVNDLEERLKKLENENLKRSQEGQVEAKREYVQ